MSSLTIGKFIGSGAYGSVHIGTWEGRKVAIKKVNISQDDVRRAAAMKREVDIMNSLVYDHIVQFYGTAFHDGMLVLVMSYAEGGSLQNAIKSGRLADWPTKERIAQEIVRGLNYIHHKGVLHRDLKSLNVLLTRHMAVKLCDFGLATIKTQSASQSSGTLKGTFRWMAPELFGAKPKYSTKSDMYALAVVMWEMAANRTTPFRDQPDNFMVMALVKGGEREELPNNTPAEYRQWVERCWDQDPDKRPEASEMVRDDDDESDHVEDLGADLSAVSISMSVLGSVYAPVSGGSSIEQSENDNSAMESLFAAALAKADEGDIEAQVEVAAMYEKGKGVAQSDSEAFKWYLQAAEQNSATAENKVGDFCFEGRGTRQRDDRALYWKLRAVAKGHVRAWYHIERMDHERRDVGRDYYETVLRFREPAKQGDAVAQYSLGVIYQYGFGVKQDNGEALMWYRKSAEQGNAAAQNSLGYMYQNSLGVKMDNKEAVSWYRKSAEQGNAAAQANLGHMYQEGLGVERDDCESVLWLRKSAEQGDAHAQNSLGLMYQSGLGVDQDHSEAASWCRKSAEQGDPVAQYELGRMYRDGLGVPKDVQQATAWFAKAKESVLA